MDFRLINIFFLCVCKDSSGTSYYYGVRIVTGKAPGGGTCDDDIYLVIIGSRGSSQKISLQGWLCALCSNLGTATYDDIVIEVENGFNLGDSEVVTIGNSGSGFQDTWLVHSVEVYRYKGQSKIFPCLHWIGNDSSVSITSEACM